ncbi:hypothetical protein [Pseudoalteromonas denitrificans]|jgi:hypothetical protein|uniref:Tetratricopeptide repeat-containing protein n=1 Tax=Pseudoalteromonas denitrificans DSM 6059 TaxID=1123010 RepID=A0A1I1I5S8_9GAMM|nr:hypothetical protein [Pseudoalteromonas denitrificans]SFC28570.1 hypothetical protein SAMN02745724_01296 [Pseudoalteromonas denitrificans DSM 6059]
MENWQNMMKTGNAFFEQCAWFDAQFYYQNAISHIETIWPSDPYNIQLLQGWICGMHNLSALFEIQGDLRSALNYLKIPHEHMFSLAQDGNQTESMQLIALKALKITLNPLLEFSQKHPICAPCLKSLQETEDFVYSSQPIIH